MSFYGANLYTVLLKFLFLLVSGLLTIDYPLDSFFAIYGVLLLVVMAYILYLKNFQFPNFSLRIIKALIGHSWSRLLDNSIRMSYYIVPISYVNYMLGVSEAALLALTLMLLKTLESVLQPLLIQLHIISINNNTYIKSKTIVIYIGITAAFSLIFYQFMNNFGEAILEFWLGRREILLLSLLQSSIPAIPAIIVVQYLKGKYESKEQVSPYLLNNLLNLLFFICAMFFFSSTVQDVITLFVLFAWVRLLINWSKTVRINLKLQVN
jgi:O-antigen/teichoic acid export membrane protein